MKKAFLLSFLLGITSLLHAQPDSLGREKTLGDVVVSATKWRQPRTEVPNKITQITQLQILRNNPQTAADLLGQSGTVFIQKSQLGGGSPMIRGFATNRVLLVVDGIRMNNAIYRSGNLQNVISIDALSTENAEVVFGPGSLIYGSDAIGGVMDFRTLEARFATGNDVQVRGSALARYSTANKENTGHADVNFGWKRWALLSSFTYSKFDDLKMGTHGGQDSYLRPEYVQRINGIDSIVQNPDPRVQRFSGYEQLNLLQKVRFKASEQVDLQYSFTFAQTGDAPRYDRLLQYRQGRLRFAEWQYGPMLWRAHSLQALLSGKNRLYDEAKVIVAYQNYDESRIDRTRAQTARHRQSEGVNAFSINWDAVKGLGKGQLFYGAEYVRNKVRSSGEETDINTGIKTPYVSRYPDGSTWSTSGLYGSYKIDVHPKATFTAGLRYSYNTLDATFDPTFIPFPYEKAEINDGALTGNAGLVVRLGKGWQLNGLVSTGYRMPNVDDIGKLFESVPGNITVPNPALRPEYAWNFEAGIAKRTDKFRVELNGFHTILNNAIVRRPFLFNGQDSIVFDNTKSRVEALQNVAKATVWGVQASAEFFFAKNLSLLSHANWIAGTETDDAKDEQVPLRHAPPFYGSTHLRYRANKLFAEAYAVSTLR